MNPLLMLARFVGARLVAALCLPSASSLSWYLDSAQWLLAMVATSAARTAVDGRQARHLQTVARRVAGMGDSVHFIHAPMDSPGTAGAPAGKAHARPCSSLCR